MVCTLCVCRLFSGGEWNLKLKFIFQFTPSNNSLSLSLPLSLILVPISHPLPEITLTPNTYFWQAGEKVEFSDR